MKLDFWHFFYTSNIQAVYLPWIVPLLFLTTYPFFSYFKNNIEPEKKFLQIYCIVFSIATIIDPLCTTIVAKKLQELQLQNVASAMTIFFVLLGDFRVFLLFYFFSEPEFKVGKSIYCATLLTLVVPLCTAIILGLISSTGFNWNENLVWIIYEFIFIFMALYLGTFFIKKHIASQRKKLRRALQFLAIYVFIYYSLWVSADLLIQWVGLDAGWGLRIIPNLLYYSFWVPVVCLFFSNHLMSRNSTIVGQEICR